MNITGMLAIGNGEDCPFCKDYEVKFVNQPDNDWLAHLQREHPKEFREALFGPEKEG